MCKCKFENSDECEAISGTSMMQSSSYLCTKAFYENDIVTAFLVSFRTFTVRRLTSLTLSFISGTHVESQVKGAGEPTGSQK